MLYWRPSKNWVLDPVLFLHIPLKGNIMEIPFDPKRPRVVVVVVVVLNGRIRHKADDLVGPVGNTACRQYGLAGARHQAFDRHPPPYNILWRKSTAARDTKAPESTPTFDIKSTIDGHSQAAPAQDVDRVVWAAPGTALDADTAPQDASSESITDISTTTPDTKSTASGDQLIKEAAPRSSAAPHIPNTNNALSAVPGEWWGPRQKEAATHAVPSKLLATGAATETAVSVQVSDGAPPKPPPRATYAPRSELPQRPTDAETHLFWNLFDDLYRYDKVRNTSSAWRMSSSHYEPIHGGIPQSVEHHALLAEVKESKQFVDAAQAASWMGMHAHIQYSDTHRTYCIRGIDAPRGPP